MCGIAGIIAWDNRFRTTRETLQRMSAAIAHRGPDADGLYLNHHHEITPANPQVALAHRRLSIIDLDPRSNQPFTDHQGRHIVFNGEIYNYRDLRSELTKLLPTYPWRTTSDTEVLLAAYTAWGHESVHHLNGMFAFAIWDDNNKSLFLARDRMGQKPLHIAALSSTGGMPSAIAFASELASLRPVPWVDLTLNPQALALYLSLGYIPNDTIYTGITKLEPATYIAFSADGTESAQYFESAPSLGHAPLPDPQTRDTTRQLLLQAVRRQLVADVPLGCFLSGGIDSSIIAAAMKSAVPPDQPVLTFSIGFDDPRYDETPYAAQVARHLGTQHRQFIVRPNAAEDLPKLAAVFGEPFADSSALPTHYLAQQTRQHVKVALSGDGADELFAGYDRYRALALTQNLAALPHSIIRLLAASLQILLPGSHPKGRAARLKRLLESAHLPPAQRYAAYVRLFQPDQLRALLRQDLLQTAAPSDNLVELFNDRLQSRPLIPNALAVDRLTYLPDDLLTKLDRASMLHALEVRSPFMDHDLVSFAAGLTTPQLLRGGPKRMLRETFAADLPDFVFKRPKMGFAVPIGDWFRSSLRPMLHDHLFAADSFASTHFNLPTIHRLIAEHEQFRVDHSQRLYALLMLELWHRTTQIEN
jgi:asparagine synthase (glutamine-hydrolysing)